MASWAALNAEAPRAAPENARDVATEEAQEAHNAVLYERALRRQQQRKSDEAKAIYTELLESSTGLSPRLRYLCAKNLATLEAELHEYDMAVHHFSEAVALDASDVVVWYQMGQAALATGQLWLARQALEAGFQVDALFWPLVHLLCDVVHAIGDHAAYHRIALYLVAQDAAAAADDGPLCAIDVAVDASFRVLATCEDTHWSLPVKRPSVAMQACVWTGVKKRKLAMDAAAYDAEAQRCAPLTYVLQTDSWLSLGKLLLEAYEDVLSEPSHAVHGAMPLRNVRVICVDFAKAPDESTPVRVLAEANALLPQPTASTVQDHVHVDRTTCESVLHANTQGTEAEPIDMDQDGDEHHEGEDARQTLRRKSRRHEEKRREEHELAARQARENNLAFRLQEFVPRVAKDRANMAQHTSAEVVFRVQQGAVVLATTDGAELHVFEDVFPRSATAPSAPQAAKDHGTGCGSAHCVERDEIAGFVQQTMAAAAAGHDVVSLLRAYLNQCGKWAEHKLLALSGEGPIHPVVLWAEKAVAGRLELLDESATKQNSVVHSQVMLSQKPSHGLTCEARLFLLELRLDELLEKHPERGPACARRSSRSAVAQLDDLEEDAQQLLLDLCCAHDTTGTATSSADGSTVRLLVRLLWLCGLVCALRGHASDAREFFLKCKHELEAWDAALVVQLVNLHHAVEISASSVERKLASLQSYDANELATVAHFDQAQTRLLTHIFAVDSQASRIDELLDDLAACERQADARNGVEADDKAAQDHNLLELVLQTVEQSSNAPCANKVLILLVLLDALVASLRATRQDELQKLGTSQDLRMIAKRNDKLSTTIQAIKLTVDRLASIISADANAANSSVCVWTRRAALLGLSKLLASSTVLLFDSPRDVLLVVCDVEEHLCGQDATSLTADERATLREHLLLAVFHSFHAIRSLSAREFQQLLDVASTTSRSSSKSKRKPSTRRDRVRAFVHAALAHMVSSITLLVSTELHASDMKALMEDCCLLLKEEEEILVRRHDSDKVGRKIVATGAVLFLHLFVALSSREATDSRKNLGALVELLHERMGQHELCAVKCVDTGGTDGHSFVAVAVDYLSDYRANYASHEGATRPTAKDQRQSKHKEDSTERQHHDNNDAAIGLDRTLAQCFRCLYDVHITTDCVDHKAIVTTPLEDALMENAMQLARVAIPIMLKRSPRNIAQKKDHLKILFALRRAADMDSEARPSPVQPSQALLEYTKPLRILSWTANAPVPDAAVANAYETECLNNLWFLLGENFILQRVRRRSNVAELIEMERRIQERVAFLIKDVHYYRPDRIRSWTRLGKALKELYQVTSDACALLLNQQRMADALVAMANKASGGDSCEAGVSFEYVLGVSLFERMKQWGEVESASHKAAFRVRLIEKREAGEAPGAASDDSISGYRMEEFAVLYTSQVVELARRCFAMAAALARARMATRGSAKCREPDQADLADVVVECCEESGLLLYNYLQEFASSRRRAKAETSASGMFPFPLYGQLLDAAHKAFEDGLRASEGSTHDAHDVRFRFHYMIGKVLKKKMWLQHAQQDSAVACTALASSEATRSIMASFAAAEDEHEKGKLERSLVHAFYQLQAMRLALILDRSTTVEQLTLACDYYFEEASDEADDDDNNASRDDSMAEDTESPANDHAVKVGKDDVAAILALAARAGDTSSTKSSVDYVCLARAWLFYNVIDALESISDEDRYFHPSRHAVARAMYHFHGIEGQLASMADGLLPEAVAKTSATACISVLNDKKRKKKNDGSTPAETAMKEMQALFDKRRPQVVAIWLSEHVPVSKKFEELNQRQLKFDVCRLKYLRYYVGLLEESHAYARIKEIGSWVLACKEEHDAVSEMLGVVLHARGVVQLARLQDFVRGELIDQLQRYRVRHEQQHEPSSAAAAATTVDGDVVDVAVEGESIQRTDDDPQETLMKELGKAYVNYVDVTQSHTRLTAVVSQAALQELVLLTAFPVVCLFVFGATEFPSAFDQHSGDAADVLSWTVAEVSSKIRAMLLHDDLSRKLCSNDEWTLWLDTARGFCERQWPDRFSGKSGAASKPSRKPRHAKASSASVVVATESVSAGEVAAATAVSTALANDAEAEPTGTLPACTNGDNRIPAEIEGSKTNT